MAYLNTIEQPPSQDVGPTEPSAAACLAATNLSANIAALTDTQPRLAAAVEPAPPDLEFVFGRDGYLTAFDHEGRWWSGCSLPKRANAAMLRSLKITGPVSCLLAPPHAASLRVSLDMTPAAHAIVTIADDVHALRVLLACDDFSAEIRRHRLWFAWGDRWAEELEKLFDERPGLPTPSQFIRLPVTAQETVDRMIQSAQGVFAAASARRSTMARDMRDVWRPATKRPTLCVLTTRQFTLWNDAAFTLGAALMPDHHGDTECAEKARPGALPGDVTAFPSPGTPGEGRVGVHLPIGTDPHPNPPPACRERGQERQPQEHGIPREPAPGTDIVPLFLDEPLHGSPLALLSAAVRCQAMVTADVARTDMPELLPRELPWVTWMTTPRVPAFTAAGSNDVLLVADPGWKRLAQDAGWPAGRVALARWPDLPSIWSTESDGSEDATESPSRGPATPALAIIADTFPLDPPKNLDDFSSQRLLWNSIRKELEADPLIVAGRDPDTYLEERLKRFSVSGEGLDRRLFAERLIVPCYGQGIARLLLGAGLPLRLYGAGWGDLPEFAPHAAGPILSRAALARAVGGSAALVNVWPMTHAHPIEAAGRPVVRPMNRRADSFIRDALSALRSGRQDEIRREDRLNRGQILGMFPCSTVQDSA